MSDDLHDTGTSPGGDGAGQQAEDVWERLGSQLAELGKAIADAMRSAADDPENQRRARELKDGFDNVTREVGDAFSEAFSGEPGQRVKEAAGAVAAASRKAADEVKPHLADFTRKAGDALRDAAARIDTGRAEPGPGTQDDTGGKGADE